MAWNEHSLAKAAPESTGAMKRLMQATHVKGEPSFIKPLVTTRESWCIFKRQQDSPECLKHYKIIS